MRKQVWTVVVLVAGYIGLQLIADIGATKIVQFGKYAIPGGTFVFALTFTWRDMLHKRLGREWARAAIISAGAVNLFMALYLFWVSRMSVAFDDAYADSAFMRLFSFVPAIVIGSIIAEVVSEWIDTDIYHRIRARFAGRWQFVRVLISNAVSLPIDSIIFGSLAFVLLPVLFGGDALPWSALPSIVAGQVAFKAIVTLVSLPMIYTVKEKPVNEYAIEPEENSPSWTYGGSLSLSGSTLREGDELE